MGSSNQAGQGNGRRTPQRRDTRWTSQSDAQTGRDEMTKEFLVVFEAGKTSFGAFAPDIPGCYGLGETLEQTRERYLEAAAAHLEWMARDHDPMPEPKTTSFDFAREPEAEASYYVVEWLPIPLPVDAGYAISA